MVYETKKRVKSDSKVFRLSERKGGWNCDPLRCCRLGKERK